MPCLGAFPVFLMPGLAINPIRVLFHGIFPIFEVIDTWAYFKDDRNFWAFLPPPPSERKVTSLLLIFTAFGGNDGPLREVAESELVSPYPQACP